MRTSLGILIALCSGVAFACGGPPCRSQSDCELGFYCVLEVSEGGRPSGQCKQDCAVPDDCPQPDSNVNRAICTNEGRCRTEARPPQLTLLEPEPETLYPEGTRTVRVSGEVESAADSVTLTITSINANGCGNGPPRAVSVNNPTRGEFSRVPFVVDGVVLDPGVSTLNISASVQGAKKTVRVDVEIPCRDCAEIGIEAPSKNQSVRGLELPQLSGSVSPPVQRGVWRVHSLLGDVFDGGLAVRNGRFQVDRIPLFAGANRVELLVTGVGSGLGEARCSVPVTSGVGRERGLRAVLVWDGPTSDLDVHIIGPGGHFGDAQTSLSSRSLRPYFGGTVLDDFDGLGPEVVTVDVLSPGVWGVVVEPVHDASDPGANAFMRLLVDGRTITAGPLGPRYLSADLGVLWVAGTLTVTDETVEWTPLDEVLPATEPPTSSPDAWPLFR